MSESPDFNTACDFRLPSVRHFIACERIDIFEPGNYSLHKIIHALRLLPGAAFPQIQPVLCLFAQMTNGRGIHSFQIDIVFAEDERATYSSPSVMLNLGDDPLTIHGWPIRLKNILFPEAGLYECRLLCDGQVIAREPILLRGSP